MRRRTTQVFSLAFLDCICCGFGAVILIFVLSLAGEDKLSQAQIDEMMRLMDALAKKLAVMSSSREDLERDNARTASLLADARMKNDSLHSLIDDLEAKLAYERSGQAALLVDLDELQKEVAARQKKREMPLADDIKPLPVGVPVGSNYVSFVIDTSGSMRDPMRGVLYPVILRKIDEVLEVYPIVKGIQVLDSDGRFIVPGGDPWLADSLEMRQRIKQLIRRYDTNATSNPVPGIVRVLRELNRPNDPEMKLGIYIFGDEFQGTSDAVIRRLDELNPKDAEGKRKVVINAIGFPTILNESLLNGESSILKFSNLMRTICYEHGGAFIALQNL